MSAGPTAEDGDAVPRRRRPADRPVLAPFTGSVPVPRDHGAADHLAGLVSGPASAELAWTNEPEHWTWDGTELLVRAGRGSDFWRHTHYGVVRDTGHFLGTRVRGEFVATVEVKADFSAQYDHAGLMVRLDAERWVKACVERIDRAPVLSTVATHGVSDWSLTPYTVGEDWVEVSLTRRRDSLAVEVRAGAGPWQLCRLAYLPAQLPAFVGPVVAAPDGSGFEARFRRWTVRPI